MARSDDDTVARGIAHSATPLIGAASDLDPLLERIGDARFVLIGEASHGTHDFYRLRAELTQRLIHDKGFLAVVAEADWPDAYRVNRFVRGQGSDGSAIEALQDFLRFPQWMWRNVDVADFVGWLREYDDHVPEPWRKVGFYGLDLYSQHRSIGAVLAYLQRVDPAAADRARERYACFDELGADPRRYGISAGLGISEDCEQQVIAQLVELQRRRATIVHDDDAEDAFAAEQDARVVVGAERYYRAMFSNEVSTWNLRDTHMADTLDAVVGHLERHGEPVKVVVWAHNSHVGDARATEMGAHGELTLGQLCRQRHRNETVLIGFTTHEGTVTAASDWDAPVERKRVRPALDGSYEQLFHATDVPRFLLIMRQLGEAAGGLREPRLERAIGVIYRPDTERSSHYFNARLPAQFDAIIHLDETRAVEPLERTAHWGRDELPETFPTGM